MRVIESQKMTASCPISTRRLALSKQASETAMWWAAFRSLGDATTSPVIDRCMSVTSSGRSSTRSMKIFTSGLFFAMAFAIVFSRKVFPAFGGATMRQR